MFVYKPFFPKQSALRRMVSVEFTFHVFYTLSCGNGDWPASSFGCFTYGTDGSSLTAHFQANNVSGYSVFLLYGLPYIVATVCEVGRS